MLRMLPSQAGWGAYRECIIFLIDACEASFVEQIGERVRRVQRAGVLHGIVCHAACLASSLHSHSMHASHSMMYQMMGPKLKNGGII